MVGGWGYALPISSFVCAYLYFIRFVCTIFSLIFVIVVFFLLDNMTGNWSLVCESNAARK